MRRQLDFAISVSIQFQSSAEAKAAVKALIPDNVNFPKGLSIKMSVQKSTLAIRVSAKGVPMPTVIATLDEVLEHISVAKKVIS